MSRKGGEVEANTAASSVDSSKAAASEAAALIDIDGNKLHEEMQEAAMSLYEMLNKPLQHFRYALCCRDVPWPWLSCAELCYAVP